MKKTPTEREKLNWIRGVIIGITTSMGEDDKERKEVLRSVGRAIDSMLLDDEEKDHETQSY